MEPDQRDDDRRRPESTTRLADPRPTVGRVGGGPQIATLDANAALVLVATWLAGLLVAASVFTERAEISG